MREIPLGRGYIARVDDEDYVWLSKYSWRYHGGYAERSYKHKKIRMHREIMRCPRGKQLDHINMDTVDNRKSNLRFCTKSENGRNRPKPKHNTSGFKGVHWYKALKKWQVYTMLDRKKIHIGYFDKLKQAVIAHNEAIKKYHGKFAHPNPTKGLI